MDVFCINNVNIDSIECIRDPCLVSTVSTYIVLVVWLKSPQSHLSKTFCWIENPLNIKKVIGRNVWMCFVSTASTCIALNALEIVMPYVDSVNIYSI